MRIVIQRVSKAEVMVEGNIVGSINKGLVVLLGIDKEDDQSDLEWLVNKLLNLRIFNDDLNKMNYSLLDVKGGLMVISQFTLCGDIKKVEGLASSMLRPQEGDLSYTSTWLIDSEMRV